MFLRFIYKIYSILLVLVLIPFSTILSANQSQPVLTEKEKLWIKEHPVIAVANELDWAPFDYSVEGKPLGYSIDIVKLIAEKTGLELQFINGYTWVELMEKFRNGEIHVMPAIYMDDERKKYMHFTSSYYSQPSVIVVHKNNQEIHDMNTLAGKTIAGVRGFLITNALKNNYSEVEVVEVETVLDAIKWVSLKKADAYIDSIGLISHTLENNFIPNLKIVGDIEMKGFSNPSLHMAISHDNDALYGIIEKGLATISREERQLLAKKWLEFHSYEKRMLFSEEQAKWINAHPVVRVGVDKNYAPYSYRNENQEYIGVVPDFIKLLSEKIGIKFVPDPGLEWNDILDKAKSRKLDVIATAVKTDERKEYFDFTPIYIPTPLVIMTRENDFRVQKKSDLKNLRVALVEGYSTSKRILSEVRNLHSFWVKTPLEALQAVATGNADAYVGVIGVNIYLNRENGITNLKIAGEYDLVSNGQRFAVRSDWPELTVLITEALDSITEEEKKDIFDKWITAPYTQPIDYILFLKVFSVFFLVIAFLYFYNRKLSREINKREIAEKNLRKSHQNLEAAKKVADKANYAKSRFISSMNHELRTPLSAIIGFSEILHSDPQIKGNTKTYVEHIKNAGEHLLDLINDIIDYSVIEAGKMELIPENLKLEELLEECLTLVNLSARQRGITIINHLNCSTDKDIYADKIRLKQVILNLLSNSIKYNNENGKVDITCVENDGFMKIEFTDTGPGLDKKQISKLFVEFERLGAERSAIQGTGIGLTISRKIIKAMGGEIGAYSKPSAGSSFWIKIPLSK